LKSLKILADEANKRQNDLLEEAIFLLLKEYKKKGFPMKKLIMLIATVSLFVASPVMAIDGNVLLESCTDGIKMLENDKSADEFNAGVCKGFILGSLQVHSLYTDVYKVKGFYCVPENASIGQLVRITSKYLKTHPENLHLGAAVSVHNAMIVAFPCK
jgi:hypothetical protein